MISKDKLGFDVTDTDTIAASDSVGAFLRASDGTLLTHTDVSGKKALDVNIANSVTTINAANFAEDSAHTSGAIGTHILAVRNDTEGSLVSTDGDYGSLQLDASGRLRVLQRALSNSSDSVAAVQSGTWTIDSITNPVPVAIDHANDSIKIGDGTNFLAFVGSTGIARTADYHTAAANSAISINNTSGGTALVASPLANRTSMFVQNLGNKAVFLGVGTVTSANGLRLSPGSVFEARIGAALNLKAISQDASAQDIRVLELA
jgi:hypothetical protein